MQRSLAQMTSAQPRPRLLRRFACALLLCAAAAVHSAEREFLFHTPKGAEELSQNTINDLHQDPDGYVWIATQNGLHRYDGYGYELYEHRPSDPEGLRDSFITALASDAERLYVGTRTRWVAALDRRTGQLQHYPDDDLLVTSSPHSSVTALLRVEGQGLWVGTAAGVDLLDALSGERVAKHRFAPGASLNTSTAALALEPDGAVLAATSEGLLRFRDAASEPESIALDETPTALLVDARGSIWIGGVGGLWRLSAGEAPHRVWPRQGQAAAPVRDLAVDGDGRLWLSLAGIGLLRYEPDSGLETLIRPDHEIPNSLPEATIGSLMLDRSGMLWLGGEVRGVATVRPRGAGFTFVVDKDPAINRIATNNIRVIHEDAGGDLWLGTEGDGLKRYRRAEKRFERYADAMGKALGLAAAPPLLRIQGIVGGGGGLLWVSSNLGLFEVDPASGRIRAIGVGLQPDGDATPVSLRGLIRARDGSLWIGSYSGGVLHYQPGAERWRHFRNRRDDPRSLSHDLVNVVFEDSLSRIWVGTLEGLNLLDPVRGTVRRVLHDPEDPQSISGNLVRSILQSRDGSLWFGTHSGLNRLAGEGDQGVLRFERFSTEDGLPNSTVYALLEDDQGLLWMSTNRGIASLDRSSRDVRRFGLRHGLQDMEFNGGAAAVLATGELAFGGLRGFNLFRPEHLERSAFQPPVVLTSVQLGSERLHPDEFTAKHGVLMRHSDRLLRFSFASLDFTAPQDNVFAYRLEGFDPDWITADNRNEATYTNLNPGSYRFKVRGSNHDGVFSSHEIDLPVRVTGPWWSSGSAKLAYLLLGASLLGLFLWRRHRLREAEQRLLSDVREREDRLKLALWGSGDEFWDWNVKDNSLYRIGADQLLGFHREQQLSTDEWRTRGVHPEDLPRVQRILQQHIVGATEHFESEHRIRNAKGEWIWVRSRGRVVSRDAEGNPLRIAGTARDITANRVADHEHRIALEVLSSMSESVAVVDLDFRFVSVNPAFCRMTGYEPDEVIGLPSSALDSDQHSPEFYRQVRQTLVDLGHWQGEMWQKRKDGEEFLGWLELSEVRDANGERSRFVAVASDITDKKRAEQELRFLANYDTLTGLPNRTLLSERLARAVVRARRIESRVAVLFLDLDRFKDVNDSMGHAAGDRILKAAAARLLSTVRETDTVARLGGDEFTVVLEEVSSIAEAERVAKKILSAFQAPLDLDGQNDVSISPSIGVSIYPDHGLVPTDLLKFADTAMYHAKDRGRNTYQVYTETMDAEAKRRATMAAALRKALERGEMSLVYQPRLSLLEGRISAVEALLRWHSAELGEIPPATFIPLAEETGLILPIGEWVLREACYTLQRWRRQGLGDVGMAVNVSVLQLLRSDLPDQIRSVLNEVGLPANSIELEVTESMVMANAEQTISVLRELKRTGVSLAIDDFGTGYSSLVYLKRLPIDTLKIDKEFIGDLTTDPDDEAITATIITMAHSLGLNVVAEGVELPEQLHYLREQGCDEIQGYWLSPPLEAHQCLAFIRSHLQGGGPVASTAP